jgi:hypothetical protein
MTDDKSILPISDEQAKLGQEILKAFSGLGSFFKEALGSVPSDLIGYLGGDWLRMRRAENIARMMSLAQEKLESRGVRDREPASLTLALPILRGAADESRKELQDLWARLMAATLDPSRARNVRQGFAEAISKMDPIDAIVLNSLKDEAVSTIFQSQNTPDISASKLGISTDELQASIWNLTRIGLAADINQYAKGATAFGREFLRVVSD